MEELVKNLPQLLQPEAASVLSSLQDSLDVFEPTQELLESATKVFACSEYVSRYAQQRPQLFAELYKSGDLQTEYQRGDYLQQLPVQLESVADEIQLKAVLRRFRNREICRIAWREIMEWATLDETLLALSELADACVDGALTKLYDWLCAKIGTPRDADGNQQRMIVLGMGKLGAYELNFSSDIDLIFCYPQRGMTDSVKPKDNEDFFTRLGRQLISAIDEKTVDGFVFRVDMRLRPFGKSGPLAMNFNSFENYYQVQGRSWERYAMIKARVIAGDMEAGAEILEMLRPFIYRRYIDFGAIESLREMKGMVDAEVKRKGIENNIKLAWGGIREIEFIGQMFQLIRGGKDKELQTRPIQEVLQNLAKLEVVDSTITAELVGAYRYLRRVENLIQAIRDEQTHNLPDEEIDRERIILGMGHSNWTAFIAELDQVRNKVQNYFDTLIAGPEEKEEQEIDKVWRLGADCDNAVSILQKAGFEEAVEVFKQLDVLRESSACRILSEDGRTRLDRLVPMLLPQIGKEENPEQTLKRIVNLLIKIINRSCYVSLLLESEQAQKQLVKLCGASKWIAEYLAQFPVLFDDLLTPETLYSPLKKDGLREDLEKRFAQVDMDDLEQVMEHLRHFKHTHVLRVAAADVNNAIDIMKVSDRLTEIAEVILEEVLKIAWKQMTDKNGEPSAIRNEKPSAIRNEKPYKPAFGIIAYGKLGGIELGYGSDLDMVFLHNSYGSKQVTDGDRSIDNSTFFARLGQKIIHLLTTNMPAGVLYEADMRLRPNGNSGLLVTSIEAFEKYQKEKAWTWEHQALARARFITGGDQINEEFARIRKEVLTRERDQELLQKEIGEMRQKMRDELENKDPEIFDLKQARGGIADIEFLVQYNVLLFAAKYDGLVEFSDNIRMLEQLSNSGFIAQSDAETLIEAYRCYRAAGHRLAIKQKKAMVKNTEFTQLRAAVTEIWDKTIGI